MRHEALAIAAAQEVAEEAWRARLGSLQRAGQALELGQEGARRHLVERARGQPHAARPYLRRIGLGQMPHQRQPPGRVGPAQLVCLRQRAQLYQRPAPLQPLFQSLASLPVEAIDFRQDQQPVVTQLLRLQVLLDEHLIRHAGPLQGPRGLLQSGPRVVPAQLRDHRVNNRDPRRRLRPVKKRQVALMERAVLVDRLAVLHLVGRVVRRDLLLAQGE